MPSRDERWQKQGLNITQSIRAANIIVAYAVPILCLKVRLRRASPSQRQSVLAHLDRHVCRSRLMHALSTLTALQLLL